MTMPSGLRADISLKPATENDIALLSALAGDPAVAPLLMAGAGDADRLLALLADNRTDGPPEGLFVIRSPAVSS